MKPMRIVDFDDEMDNCEKKKSEVWCCSQTCCAVIQIYIIAASLAVICEAILRNKITSQPIIDMGHKKWL